MFKVVPFWEFCMLVYSMFLLKSCQISVLRLLVFLTVCSSIILLGFSFCCSKNPTFGHKRFNSSSKIFSPGVNVYFSVFVLKFNIFNIYANLQYLYKSSIFIYICFPLSGLCTSRLMSYFRSQREGILSFLLVFAFSYFCGLFKSFVNRFGVFVTFITIFSFSELVWW